MTNTQTLGTILFAMEQLIAGASREPLQSPQWW